ncbi:MAG: hypothetical protein PWQ54_54 [Bacteroidales bacterium]|jgi:hypothetical protein|nr:hypothetical protein [Bacteroidales bacterium]
MRKYAPNLFAFPEQNMLNHFLHRQRFAEDNCLSLSIEENLCLALYTDGKSYPAKKLTESKIFRNFNFVSA